MQIEVGKIPEQTLYPSKAKVVFVLLASLLFTVGGILAAIEGEQWGHLLYLIFGLTSGLGVMGMRKNTNYLKLRDHEFEVATLFRKTRIKWDDIDSFGIVSTTTYNGMSWTLVGWDYKKGVRATPIAIIGSRAHNKWQVGKDETLPDSYGLRPTHLLSLMNERLEASRSAQ